jgi:hypothetical protein
MVYIFGQRFSPNMRTTFHLNWLRESTTGHLEADLGTSVPNDQLELAIMGLLPEQQPGRPGGAARLCEVLTPAALPGWARRRIHHFFAGEPCQELLTQVEGFCNRIRDKAWNIDETQLFIPYFSRRDWNERFSRLPEIAFDLTPDGVVAEGVDPHCLRQVALRTAASVFKQAESSAPIRFTSTKPMVAPWRTLLLERYGLDVSVNAPPVASLPIEATGSLLSVWQNTPRERHCHYYPVFSRMALAIQESLRRWILAAYALEVEDVANFEAFGDIVAYAAVRPHAERRQRDFSYDVLDPDLMDYAFGRASRRLEPLLRSAYAVLMDAGREDDALQYARTDLRIHAPRLAERAKRRYRVRAMLVSEGVLIYALIKFAGRLRMLDSARAITTAVDELTHSFDERIRRLFFFAPREEADAMSTMVFLEASNAIAAAMNDDQALAILCTTADGEIYRNVRSLSDSLLAVADYEKQ